MPPHHLSPINLGITLTSTRNIASELIVFCVPSDVVVRCIFLIILQLTERVVFTESYCPTVLTMFFSYDIVFLHVSGSVHVKKRYYISHFYFRDNPTERLGYQKGGLKDIMKNKYGIRHCPLL